MQRADIRNWKVFGDSYSPAKFADVPHGEQIDEMLNRDKHINPHWRGFMQALDTLGLAEMESRHKEVQRLLRENSVTYVVHGEQQGHRPWELDPIPLIISKADWDAISAGLTQRAELLNLILTDLYGERVWLKSIDGLRPVDIILRRVDDIFCDPLELRQDSRLGVAGLLEAIRQGNVIVINPPGSSVLENPGLMEHSKRLIGEELRLPSVATWWYQNRVLRILRN